MHRCPTCSKDVPDQARFCPSCGMPLTAVSVAAQGDLRKVVTILFCDISGSTSLAEQLESEVLRRLLRRYFSTMEAILVGHGGTVEKFIGDAIMAVFGIPAAREDDALRAVRAAVEMRTSLHELNEQFTGRWGVRLRVRTGVNTGEVVAGNPSHGHGFVTGDAVNVAARLQQAAAPDDILIGASTQRLVRDVVDLAAVEPLALKGKAEPVPAFRVVDVTVARAALARRLRSPLVGRRAELERLRAALATAVAERRCVLVPVVGPAGVGKSRLAAEFTTTLADHAMTASGHCLSYGDGVTFWPMVGVIRRLTGITADDGPELARAKIASRVAGDQDAEVIAERVAAVLGLTRVETHASELFWAVRRLLEAAAAERPLVVVIDDLHWAEPTLLELIEHLARTSRAAPVLVLALGRTDAFEQHPSLTAAATDIVELGPLGGDETHVLAQNLLGDEGLPPGVADRVFAAAEGNPLFVEELLRLLIDEGYLRREGDRWSAPRAISTISMPPSIQAIVAARVDRLTSGERAVIERAAVAGRRFWPAAVRALAPPGRGPDVDASLRGLIAKQLVEPDSGRFAGEPGLRFSHGLVRDVVYQAVLKASRADLHERFATWLERTAGERATEYEEILGYHLEQAYRNLGEVDPADARIAGLASRAAKRLAAAGSRVLARGDMPAAVGLLERASSLLGDEDPRRRDVAIKLGIALAGTGQLSRVNLLLAEQVEVLRGRRACLVYEQPDGRQQALMLNATADVVTIGRHADNELALFWDREVSRRHAELRREQGGWVLLDEGTSRYGTYVNGERLIGRHRLADGDVVRVGDSILLYRTLPGRQPRRDSTAVGDDASRLEDSPLRHIRVTDVERRVLRELRGSADAPAAAAALSQREIAERAGMSEDEVVPVLRALKLKFGVEGAFTTQWRERLVVRATTSGLISEVALPSPQTRHRAPRQSSRPSSELLGRSEPPR